MRRAVPVVGMLSLLLLGACEEQQPRRVPRVVEPERGGAPPKWLSLTDDRDPAAWLAAHRSGAAPAEVEIARLRRALAEAGMFFLESPRMLANRQAQLGDMLFAAGVGEDDARLLADLSRVAAASARKQTFGQMCQHYYNLRRQGQGRADALAALAERYAMQNREP